MNSSSVIEFRDATVLYQNQIAMESISLSVDEGEFLGIIGPNGSGKTTLLRAVLGLVQPVRGHVHVFDCSCAKLKCHHRARIGYLPQKEMSDPHFPISVFETVLMGRYSSIGLFKYPSREDRSLAYQALEEVELRDLADAPLGRLSGGQQQRVLIARALAQQPKLLLLDEPTTGLDFPRQQSLMELIQRLHASRRLTILLVTHDINLVSPICDRLILLKRRLYAVGPPKSVLTPEILSEVYGKGVVVTENRYVIVSDHHHH